MRDGLLRLASTASLALAPVLLVQGRAVRRRTPRLPEAEPPFEGAVTGTAPGLRLLVLGESTAAGVGVSRHEEGLAGQTARALAATTGCSVRWAARGRNGATAFETHRDLLPAVTMPQADVVVLALGVNDTVRLHAPRRWTRDLTTLVEALRVRLQPIAIVLAGVPPLHHFPALPFPLRHVLGLRAHVLARAARHLVARWPDLRYAGLPAPGTPEAVRAFFARDGYHPCAAGYTAWAAVIAAAAAEALETP